MRKLFASNPPMSAAQKEAEQEAIRLLTYAQELLMEDENNVEEAQRIRFEVTEKLLPSRKMFIVGDHPKSLLKDVDTRIRHAYIRYYRDIQNRLIEEKIQRENQANDHRPHSKKIESVPVPPRSRADNARQAGLESGLADRVLNANRHSSYDYRKLDQEIDLRYAKAAKRSAFLYLTSVGWILFFLSGTFALALILRSIFGENTLYTAFHWLYL